MDKIRWFVFGVVVFALGCGTFTGIPSHGGGKRFAIEQELISASARAAAKSLKIDALKGKKVAVYITTIGDEGAGNLFGGRFELQGALVDTAKEHNSFPNPANFRSGRPLAPTTINYPRSTETKGIDVRAGTGAPNTYRSEPFANPNDKRFLSAVINEALILQGVLVVPPAQADVFLYVSVDVFGTERTRTNYFVINRERLAARTGLHALAFDKARKVVLPPATSSWEAEYIENYICWIGPTGTVKQVTKGDDLLVDFTSIGKSPEGEALKYAVDTVEDHWETFLKTLRRKVE
jgi:hypothetical protein